MALHDWFAVGGAWLEIDPPESPGSTTPSSSRPASPAWSGHGGAGPRTARLDDDRRRDSLLGRRRGVLDPEDPRRHPAPPYPSPADIGYLAFYPLAALGLALLVRARASALDWRLWMDGAIAALGTAALGTAFVFDFVADQTTGTSLQVATTLAYPLADIVLLSLMVGVIALTRWRPGRAWSLLLVGLAALALADVAYTLQSTDLGLPKDPGSPIYLIAASCLGAQAWQPAHRRADLPGPLRRLARADGPGALRGGDDRALRDAVPGHASSLASALWAATMIAVIVRLAISVRENRSLLEQVRTDPLTGLGSRGAPADRSRRALRRGDRRGAVS